MEVYPTIQSLQTPAKDVLKTLPVVPLEGPFDSGNDYLDTMFQLLHADCFNAMRSGIQLLMSGRYVKYLFEDLDKRWITIV